jgi:outer membrane cobalamin receptor
MRRIKVFYLTLLFLFTAATAVLAQNDSVPVKKDSLDFYDMSLEQLLTLKAHGVPSELEKIINSLIAVASKKPLNVRESPSIVSLITEEEIKKSGARDIMDVLRLVPGIDFGLDVEGVVGIGMRGNWAHEGKVLVLLDGQETNEILFATTQFGNHYPISQIKKIEVIRGPGSAIYGGFAEYGVINIITKQAEDINGLNVSGTYGAFQNCNARQNANLSIGKKKGDFAFSLSGVLGKSQRSDQIYTDMNDSTYNMAGNSDLNTKYVNAAIAYKGLSARYIADFYETKVGTGYGDVVKTGASIENYNSQYAELKYVIKLNEKFTLTPRVNYKIQTPWQTPSYDGRPAYDRTATRATGNLTALWNINRHINFVFGTETYQDKAHDNVDSSFFSNGTKDVSYYNYSFFGQGLIKTRFVNFIVGARYDKHNAYGSAFVPRVGLKKKYDRFHFKALYSGAFRAPAIENIETQDSTGIHPELTQVLELELGYQITHKSILTVNAYDITTNDPIIYYSLGTTDYYHNFGHAGTRGVEAELRIKDKWGYIAMNYAFYTAANKELVSDYRPDTVSSNLLAFANHRANLNACVNVAKGLSLNLTASLYGPRWAMTSVDTLGNYIPEQLPVMTLLNFFVNYDPPFIKGLSIGAGCYDILDQKLVFIQPYNSGHRPLPGPTREFLVKLSYNLNFKNKK